MADQSLAAVDQAEMEQDLAMLESDAFVSDALKRGTTLIEYSKKVERELREVEVESVRDYVQQSSQVADLHAQMQRCDGILAKMQETLLGFEFDLGSASRELRSLQRESKRMSVKLRNRRATEARLGAFLAAVALSPDVAVAVATGPWERFLSAVTALDSTLRYARGGGEIKAGADAGWRAACVGARAVGDAAPLHDKLEQKASLRCRDYLLEKIEALRTSQTNIHLLQRTQLAKYSYLYRFLEGHAPDHAAEVRTTYVESMAKTLHALFRAYHAALDKHDLEVANKFDVVAVEEHAMRSQFTSRVSLTKRGDGFSLGDRCSLRHLAARRAELQFVSAFLYGGGRSDAVQATVAEIFAKALSATVEHLENKLFACHDVVGLLLVLRLVRRARADAAKRPETAVAALDGFFASCERLLKPRLDAILTANLDSVAKADPRNLGPPGVLPHYVARRYAELHASVAALLPAPPAAPDNGAGDAAAKEAHAFAARLRASTCDLLGRLGGRLREPKDRVVFLINNYDQILSIFLERGLEAGDDTEAEMRTPDRTGDLNLDAPLVERLTRDFAATWKNAILQVNSDVLSYFANFVNGMEVLKQVLTQLLLYYTRFQEIVRKAWRRPPPFAKNLVPTNVILAEIKKYSLSFE
ncbi:hypothetical protein JL721_10389 [Aureococcus anophagefferens]|nr:hypothetical protein JL721_10389 [Aureococcus anophagefferens]